VDPRLKNRNCSSPRHPSKVLIAALEPCEDTVESISIHGCAKMTRFDRKSLICEKQKKIAAIAQPLQFSRYFFKIPLYIGRTGIRHRI
jgi:hypothetical protein